MWAMDKVCSWAKLKGFPILYKKASQMEKFMNNVEEESVDFAKRLISATEQNESIDPIKFLELNSMNVIFQALFGRKFDSIQDPEFCKLSEMVERSAGYAGLDQDLPNFLPILSLFKSVFNKTKQWARYVNEERDPAFKKLIEEAYEQEGPNVVKMLDEFDMDLEEKIIFMCKLIEYVTALSKEHLCIY